MKVFIAIASVKLAYGGPAISVAALANRLASAGIETGLWCPDGSAPSIAQPSQPAILRLLAGSLGEAVAAFGQPDVFHDNGIWWAHNHTIARYALRHQLPRVVSLRGMLEPWARQHKRLKKAVAWPLYQARDLRSAQMLHATSAQEGANLAAMMPGAPITEIGNGLAMPGPECVAFGKGDHSTWATPARRQALFVGRLHPVKGLPMLLQAWHQAALEDWDLVIAGPDEAGHRRELEAEIARLRLGAAVSLVGAVSGDAKARLFKASQLFVLPSYSESFGMAVGEALAHGLPVITTMNVPWPQLEALHCGWRAEASADALAAALARAAQCPREQLAEMGQRGRQLVADEFSWAALTPRFIRLYERLVAHDGRLETAC